MESVLLLVLLDPEAAFVLAVCACIGALIIGLNPCTFMVLSSREEKFSMP
jgi:hypothetical protein